MLRSRKALNKFSSNKTLVSWGTTNAPVFPYCLQKVTANVQTGFVLCFSQRSSVSSLLTSPFTDKMLTLTSAFLTRSYVTEFPSQNLMHHLITQQVETHSTAACDDSNALEVGAGTLGVEGHPWLPGKVEASLSWSFDILSQKHKNKKNKQPNQNKNIVNLEGFWVYLKCINLRLGMKLQERERGRQRQDRGRETEEGILT